MINSKISIVKVLIVGIAMLMLGNSNILAQAVSVSLPTLIKAAGSPSEFIDVTVGNISGQNVASFQFDINYDPAVCKITEASTTGLSLTGSQDPVYNADTVNGVMHVAWASGNVISGSGTVLLMLKVSYSSTPGTSPLTFNNFQMSTLSGTSVTVNLTNGSVTIPTMAVSFPNMNEYVGDTVLIPVTTTALTSSDNITAYKFTSAYNASVLNVIDYSLTNTLSAGGQASINLSPAGSVSFAWAKATSITGSGVLVYLKAVVVDSGTSNLSFNSFEFNAGVFPATINGNVIASLITTYSLSGTVTYANSVSTPLGNVIVTLTPASGTAMIDTTGAAGTYSFPGLSAGTYTISVAKTGDWGGVNASDALEAARYFQSLVTLDSIQILAGDVNNDNLVNSSDALSIIQRYVGIINSFNKPDWTFLPSSESVTITNSNTVVNVMALATGDIDESYVPASTPKAGTLSLFSQAAMNVKPGTTFEVPISAASDMQAGAVSLKLSYPASLVKFDGISTLNGFLAHEKDGVITIGWADMSGGNNPLNLKKNSVLATVKFTANNNLSAGSNLTFNLLPGSEFVDAKGVALNNSGIAIPEVNVTSPSTFSLRQNYPNPFNPSTTIEFSLPESGNVTITIYNVTGQEVAKLVNGVQNAGSHKIVWNASNLSSGIYFYRLNFDGSNKKYSDIKSMVLLK